MPIDLKSRLQLSQSDPGFVTWVYSPDFHDYDNLHHATTPDEHAKLNEMLEDSQVGGKLGERVGALLGRSVTIEPASKSKKDKDAAAIAQSILDTHLPYEEITGTFLLHGLLHRFAVQAVSSYDKVDADVGGKKVSLILPRLELVPPRRFTFQPFDPARKDIEVVDDAKVDPRTDIVIVKGRELRLLTKRANKEGERCPKERFFCYSPFPEGVPGLGKRMRKYYQIRQAALKSGVLTGDRLGSPPVHGTYPADLDPDDPMQREVLGAFNALLRSMSPNFNASTTDDFKINFPVPLAGSQQALKWIYDVASSEITRIVWGEGSYSEKETGSYGAEQQQSTNRNENTVDADCNTLDEGPLKALWEWIAEKNYPNAGLPIVKRETYSDVKQRDREVEEEKAAEERRTNRINSDNVLVQMGLTFDQDYVTEVYGKNWKLPAQEPAPEEEVEEPAAEEEAIAPDEDIAEDAELEAEEPSEAPPELSEANFAANVHRFIDWNGLKIGLRHAPGETRFPQYRSSKKLRSGYGFVQGFKQGGKSLRCYVHPSLLQGEGEGDRIFSVAQVNPRTGDRDEPKLMIGYPSIDAAELAYRREMPEGYFGGIEEVKDLEAIADYRSDFEESFDFYDPKQARDSEGRWTSGLSRAANTIWSRKTQELGRDVNTGKEYSPQVKSRRTEEYMQEVRAAYLRHGNQMSKAIIASKLLTDPSERDDDYKGSESDLLDTMIRRSLNKIDSEPLSKAILETSGIDLTRSKERDRPVFKDEEMDVDAALRRYFDGWEPGRQDVEEISARAIAREDWARREIVNRLELDRLPSQYRPFLKDALEDLNIPLLENLLLGGKERLTRQELEEEGYEFTEHWSDTSEDFAEGVKLSDLEKNSEGQYKYQGEWWTLNSPKPAPEDSKKKKRVLASKRVNGVTYVKIVSFGHRDYNHNSSKDARKNYLARSAGITNKQGEKTAGDRFSPNYWSRTKLWSPKSS